MIIQFEEYRKAKAQKARTKVDYDDELLCVNWNAAVAVSPISLARTAAAVIPDLPELYAAGLDFEEFMARTYALATQI